MTNSSKFLGSNKNNPCPICGRTNSDSCRIADTEQLVLCHTEISRQPRDEQNGFVYLGESEDGTWGKWVARSEDWKKERTQDTEFRYPFYDKSGNLIVEEVRRYNAQGQKDTWMTPSGVNTSVLLPYRYNEALSALQEGAEHCLIVEGPPKADIAWDIGIPAVAFANGFKPRRDSHWFEGFESRLMLVPDQDQPGIEKIKRLSVAYPMAKLFRPWPNSAWWEPEWLPKGGGKDFKDWVEQLRAKGIDNSEIKRMILGDAPTLTATPKPSSECGDLVNAVRDLESRFGMGTSAYEYGLHKIAKTHGVPRNAVELIYFKAITESFESKIRVLEEFESDQEVVREWIIAGLLPKSSTVLFYADGGTGKTLLVYDMIRAIYDREEYLGKSIAAMPRILLIQTDEPEVDCRARLSGTFAAKSPAKQNLLITTQWTFGSLKWLRSKVQDEKIELVIIDSFSSANRAAMTEEKDAMHAAVLYELRDIAQDLNCTFLILHHTNKRGESRGSTAMRNNVSECWQIRRHNPEIDPIPLASHERVFRVEKSRSGVNQSLVVSIGEDETFSQVGSLDDLVGANSKESQPATWAEKIMLYFDSNPNTGVTSTMLTEMPIFKGLVQDTAKKTLQRLHRKGLITANGYASNSSGGKPSPIFIKTTKTLSQSSRNGSNVGADGIRERDDISGHAGTIGTGSLSGQEKNITGQDPSKNRAVPMPSPVDKPIQGKGLTAMTGQEDSEMHTHARENPLLSRMNGNKTSDKSAKPVNPYTGPKVGDSVQFTAESLSEADIKRLRKTGREYPWGAVGKVVDVDYTTKNYFVMVETADAQRFVVDNFLAIEPLGGAD